MNLEFKIMVKLLSFIVTGRRRAKTITTQMKCVMG